MLRKILNPLKARRLVIVIGIVFLVAHAVAFSQAPLESAGIYSELDPAQKALVDDWFHRYSQVMGEQVDQEKAYESLSQSTKTTFEAVTHALIATELTGADGESLGRAIDLVTRLDEVAGKIKGASGDLQFRIYIQLRPDAREILEKSAEFKRGPNNTIYHKGYPLSYRQQGGTPSMQVSIAKDGRMADIDVDYRSSSFPVALINGHLSSSNSDVRAGPNHSRHVNRWDGLSNWWEEWFGLPFVPGDENEEAGAEEVINRPSKKYGKIEEAAYDFLKTWLVDQHPRLAMAYFSARAFSCEDPGPEGDFDLGMAPFKLLTGLRSANRVLGAVEDVADVAVGIRVAEPGLVAIEQPHHQNFVVYAVSDATALQFLCGNERVSEGEVPKGAESRFKKYRGTIFHLVSPQYKGETIALLWAKESGYWKIVAYEIEPDADGSDSPDLRPEPAVASAAIPRVKGDRDFVKASRNFYRTWLLKGKFEKAVGYFSPESYSCNNLFLLPGEQPVEDDAQGQALILRGLEEIADELGKAKDLDEIVQGLELESPEMRIIEHGDEDAYTLVEIPDHVAQSYNCQHRLDGGSPLSSPGQPVYGNAFASGWKARMVKGDTSALYLFWHKSADGWRINAFHLESP